MAKLAVSIENPEIAKESLKIASSSGST